MFTTRYLLFLSLCVSFFSVIHAGQTALEKMTQKYANELGQRLIKAIKAYDGDMTDIDIALAFEPDINIKDKQGATPLLAAAANEKIPLEIIKDLYELGADLNARDKDGNTALHRAIMRGQGQIEAVMKQVGIPFTLVPTILRELHASVVKPRESILQFLVDKGADVNIQNNKGETPLFIAIMQEKSDLFDDNSLFIVLPSSRIDLKDASGNTALLWAVQRGRPYVVQRLLQKGANPYSKNKEGKNAFDLAKVYPNIDMLLQNFDKKHAQAMHSVAQKVFQPGMSKQGYKQFKFGAENKALKDFGYAEDDVAIVNKVQAMLQKTSAPMSKKNIQEATIKETKSNE